MGKSSGHPWEQHFRTMGVGHSSRTAERAPYGGLVVPSKSSGKDDGPTLVWAQQRAKMQEMTTEEDEVKNINPRTACSTGFRKWANSMSAQGNKLVVLVDANQSLGDTSEPYNLKDLVED